MSGYEKALRYSPPLDPYLTGLVKLENVRTVHIHCLCAVLSFSPSLFPLHCIALHCTTLRYTTSHYNTSHYTTSHYATLPISIFQFLISSFPDHCPSPSSSHTSSHSVLPFYLYFYSGEEVAQSFRG